MNASSFARGLALAAILAGGPAGAQPTAPKFELEIDLADEITLANRPTAIGTNVRNARVARQQLKRGRIEELVTPPIVDALKACTPMKPDTGRLRVRVAEGEMRDSIGDSLTQLKGIGLYLNLPVSGVVDTGTWSVSPYVALVIELKDEKGRVLASQDVAGYDREVAPEGMTAGDFMAKTSANLDAILDRVVRPRIAKAMPALLAGVCAPK
jgi:hypothetical protein